MKSLIVPTALLSVFLSGCGQVETKKTPNLISLNCASSRENRTQEELQAIGDACFRGGNYSKSSGKKW